MRSGKFWFVLIIIFIATFMWAGGSDTIQQRLGKAANVTKLDTVSNFDDNGPWNRIYRIFALKQAVKVKVDQRNYTKLQDIPFTLQQAIIAVEDNRFYNHYGFDIEAIARATLVNVQTGGIQEGGSTITQQLVKNLFLSQNKTWGRKAEEMVLAVDMEMRYSKEEILELYLNTIYFGSGAKGINQAAKVYFNKTPAELTLAESTMLAGLPNAPSVYSPLVDFAAAKQRQAIVLAAMVRHGYIGPNMAQEAKEAPLKLAK